MDDTATHERIAAALDRIEAGVARLRTDRDRAERRYTLLDDAAQSSVAALDALIAGDA